MVEKVVEQGHRSLAPTTCSALSPWCSGWTDSIDSKADKKSEWRWLFSGFSSSSPAGLLAMSLEASSSPAGFLAMLLEAFFRGGMAQDSRFKHAGHLWLSDRNAADCHRRSTLNVLFNPFSNASKSLVDLEEDFRSVRLPFR